MIVLKRCISGGQTGGDCGGLAAGVYLNLETGGWAPKGWRTQRGPAPWLANFGVKEHPESGYPPRTIANVQDSDGTLWIGNELSPGGKLTCGTCMRQNKPLYKFGRNAPITAQAGAFFREWLDKHQIVTLNVAGNREESSPGIEEHTKNFIISALQGYLT